MRVEVDDKLLAEARRLNDLSSGKATVEEALQEYIQRRRHCKIIDLFGKIDYYPDYHYKKSRRKK